MENTDNLFIYSIKREEERLKNIKARRQKGISCFLKKVPTKSAPKGRR